MKKRGLFQFSGDGLRARVMRGISLTLLSYGGSNIMRLGSNLILTRLLFPEAFGLMALVQVFISGLQMFSDTGIRVSIMQHERGDEPAFLNTAWTIQVVRGFFLWLAACGLTWPAVSIYNEPMLAQLLPVAGLNALISGFASTNVATSNRHLILGRLTAIDLFNQAMAILIMIALTFIFQSVWALVIGGLIANVMKVLQYRYNLPGIRNTFYWEPKIGKQLFHFGKYLFLSTASGFLINQGDRAILGGFISMTDLGIYNVGYFLGAIPFSLSFAIGGRIIFPLYRMKPPAESRENQRKIFRARRMLTASLISINAVLAFGGVYLVDFLYDDRYALSGPIVVLVSLALVPQIVLTGYGSVLLANGDSRRHLMMLGSTAILQTLLLFYGAAHFGIGGAVLAPSIAALLVYPMRIRFIGHYKAWDLWHDVVFLTTGAIMGGIACWLNWDRIALLFV